MDTLENKVVIVTGASSGIGLACARRFAEAGAKVVFAARNRENISSVLHELKAKGCIVHFVETDVRDENDCSWLIAETEGLFGSPHVLVNNAGISMRALFSESDPASLREVMETNFWGAVNCTRFALPHLLRNKGSLVTISSLTGQMPRPNRAAYCASKYALEGFMSALRVENKNLHVMLVRPGFTNTNIRKAALNRYGLPQLHDPREKEKLLQPGDVAARIFKGLLRRERECTLANHGKLTLLLYKFFPALAEQWIRRASANETNSLSPSQENEQEILLRVRERRYKSVAKKDRRCRCDSRQGKKYPQPGWTAD